MSQDFKLDFNFCWMSQKRVVINRIEVMWWNQQKYLNNRWDFTGTKFDCLLKKLKAQRKTSRLFLWSLPVAANTSLPVCFTIKSLQLVQKQLLWNKQEVLMLMTCQVTFCLCLSGCVPFKVFSWWTHRCSPASPVFGGCTASTPHISQDSLPTGEKK